MRISTILEFTTEDTKDTKNGKAKAKETHPKRPEDLEADSGGSRDALPIFDSLPDGLLAWLPGTLPYGRGSVRLASDDRLKPIVIIAGSGITLTDQATNVLISSSAGGENVTAAFSLALMRFAFPLPSVRQISNVNG